MNRKGALVGSESIILMWRIALVSLTVFFVAITLGPVFVSKYDVRNSEALILSGKIIECISSNGLIKSDFDIKECYYSSEYYINASLFSLDSSLKKESVSGYSLETECRLLESGKTKISKYPSCLRQRYYVLIDNNGKTEKGGLDILIGIRKYSDNLA